MVFLLAVIICLILSTIFTINLNLSFLALALNGPDLSEEDIEKKTKPLIDEFLHNADFEVINYFLHLFFNILNLSYFKCMYCSILDR